MLPLLPVLTLLIAFGSAHAEMRTWRDQKTAQAIVAELLKVDGKNIVIRLENGRKYTLPVERFHKDDQAYVKQWEEDVKAGYVEAASDGKKPEVGPEIRRALRLSAKEESESESTRSEDRKTKTKTTKTIYALNLSVARGVQELKDVKLDYTVYKRSRVVDTKKKSDGRTRIVRERGEHKIASLAPGATQVIKTKPVSALDQTKQYQEKKKRYEKRTSEDVLGIIVDVTIGGAEALHYEYPSSLGRKVEKEKY